MMKKFWLSKTFWFNAVNGLFAAMQTMGWTQLPVSGEEQTAVLVVGNLILRLITRGGVTLSGLVAPLVAPLFFLAAPANAVSLLASDSDVVTIGSADSFTGVVAIDTASILFTGGAISGNLTLLGQSTATLSGGSLGALEVFNDAAATLQIETGTALLDGSPLDDAEIITSLDCSSCTISAVLAGGAPFTVVASVLQNGEVRFSTEPVPEPGTALLMGLGLFGLGLFGRRVR